MPSVAAHLRLHRLQLSSRTTGRNSGLSSSASGWRRLCALDCWGRAGPALSTASISFRLKSSSRIWDHDLWELQRFDINKPPMRSPQGLMADPTATARGENQKQCGTRPKKKKEWGMPAAEPEKVQRIKDYGRNARV